jgi:hypothetical protein
VTADTGNVRLDDRLKSFLVVALALAFSVAFSAPAQVLDKYDVQLHGYATQGFLYTTQNNIYTTDSSDGSPRWTDAVVNIGAIPSAKIRVGAQVRYFLFGNYSNGVSLDWAQVDYRVNQHFGVRAGKVKTPSSLFNEVQDIDPAYIWSLLPPSVYPVSSRNSFLSHVGGVAYGNVQVGDGLGKLEYRAWGGRQKIGPSDGIFVIYRELGLDLPEGLRGGYFGGTLRWKTPISGLLVGAADTWKSDWQSKVVLINAALTGKETVRAFNLPNYFLSYSHGKFEAAAECTRVHPVILDAFPGLSPITIRVDTRAWYVLGSYKVTKKLGTGLYFSEQVDHAALLGNPARFSKDWALAARYDFNQYLYLKAEQHFIDGTAIVYDTDLNPRGLKPDTRLTILKIGVSF